MDNEILGYFFQCTSWLSSILDLAIGVAAFVRLRTTPSGLLIGGGFTLMALFGMTMRVVRLIMEPGADAFDVDYESWMMQSEAISSVTTCGAILFMVVIGIGFFLLPKSLAKVAEGHDATE
jgi:hypothetical protein